MGETGCVAADYSERIERDCQYCGNDPDECYHRTTWEDRSKPIWLLIEQKDGKEGYSIHVKWKTGGRLFHAEEREEAMEKAADKILCDEKAGTKPDVSLDEVDIVARNCTYSLEELKGSKRLDLFTGVVA